MSPLCRLLKSMRKQRGGHKLSLQNGLVSQKQL